MDRLTVLVIAYNHVDNIEKCLESILSQKTDFTFSIHVLDDASNDGTSDIVRQYAESYPNKIKSFIQENNLGVVENVFSGIKRVNTQYYATVESDDYWLDKTKLQQQVDLLDTNPDCSFCGHNTIIEEAGKEPEYLFSTATHNIKRKYSFPSKFRSREFVKIHPSSRVYRTESIDFTKLKDISVICWDSCSYWYFLSKGKMLYIDKAMSCYRYTGQGIVSGATKQKQIYLAIENILAINVEFDYSYHHIFYELLYKHKKEMTWSIFQWLLFRYFPKQVSKTKFQ